VLCSKYDVSGSWSATSGPLAPLHACSSGVGVDTAIDYWTGAGFPAPQILLYASPSLPSRARAQADLGDPLSPTNSGLPAYSTSFTLASSQLTNSTTTIGGYTSQLYNAKTGVTPQGNPATDVDSGPSTDACGNESSGGYSGQWQMKDLVSAGVSPFVSY